MAAKKFETIDKKLLKYHGIKLQSNNTGKSGVSTSALPVRKLR